MYSHYSPPGGKELGEISKRPQESPDLQMWFYLTEVPQAFCTTQVINANYEMSVSLMAGKVSILYNEPLPLSFCVEKIFTVCLKWTQRGNRRSRLACLL